MQRKSQALTIPNARWSGDFDLQSAASYPHSGSLLTLLVLSALSSTKPRSLQCSIRNAIPCLHEVSLPTRQTLARPLIIAVVDTSRSLVPSRTTLCFCHINIEAWSHCTEDGNNEKILDAQLNFSPRGGLANPRAPGSCHASSSLIYHPLVCHSALLKHETSCFADQPWHMMNSAGLTTVAATTEHPHHDP